MNIPRLSICIPTYNRSDIVYESVTRILKSPNRSFEIVVVDNASPDDTVARLNSIGDPRLSLYCNSSNLGAVKNFIEVLRKAKGEWILTLSDEDIVTPEILSDILGELSKEEHRNTSVILGNIPKSDGGYYVYFDKGHWVPYQYTSARFTKGDEAICNAGFHHKYMSGLLMRKSALRETDLVNFAQTQGGSPYNGIYTGACLSGDAVFVDFPVCIKNERGGTKSFVEKTNNKNYRHPDNRWAQFQVSASAANEMLVEPQNKAKVLFSLYQYYLDSCTNEWARTVGGSSVSSFYGFEQIENIDFSKEAKTFHQRAKNHVISILPESEERSHLLERMELERSLLLKAHARKRIEKLFPVTTAVLKKSKRRIKKLISLH